MSRARAAAIGAATLVPVLLGAGEAAGERAAASPAQTVKSADGGLTVSVPAGALAKPTRVRIRTLSRAQYPPELRNARFRPGTRIYALEPSGTRFLKPVTITRRLDTKLAGFEAGAVPGIILATRDAKGKWEILRAMRARLEGRTLVLTGATRHFSSLIALDQGFSAALVPPSVDQEVGAVWEATVAVKIDNRRRKDPIEVDLTETDWLASGAVDKRPSISRSRHRFACGRAGTGRYIAEITISEEGLVPGIFKQRYTETIDVGGSARCRPSRLQLAVACVAVSHTPFGSFPSLLRWLLQFSGAPANTRVELSANGMNNGQPVVGVVGSNGRVELQGGISSFGAKQVQRLAVGGTDLTQQLVAKVGAAPVVTSAQGVIGGTCP